VGIVTQHRNDLDTYLAWLDETPLDEIPPGEDVSDLGALGETRCTTFSREEIIRRVAFARGRGRSWHAIAAYLGITEEAARRLYGDQGQKDSPSVVMRTATRVISEQIKVIFRTLSRVAIHSLRGLSSEMHRERTKL
jgi:hypothetical protein